MSRLCLVFLLVSASLLTSLARAAPVPAATAPVPLGITLSGTQWGRP